MNLDWLARKYDTDKSSSSHGYTEFYEQIFGADRERIHSILELGVSSGASVRMWEDWFPNATIYGVDQSPATTAGRIVTFVMQQDNEDELKRVFQDKHLQIIIDDCSHHQDKTIESLKYLYPLLEPGGWYVIEDMDLNAFPPILFKWAEQAEYRSIHVYMNKGGGCHIYFIHKK